MKNVDPPEQFSPNLVRQGLSQSVINVIKRFFFVIDYTVK